MQINKQPLARENIGVIYLNGLVYQLAWLNPQIIHCFGIISDLLFLTFPLTYF